MCVKYVLNCSVIVGNAKAQLDYSLIVAND